MNAAERVAAEHRERLERFHRHAERVREAEVRRIAVDILGAPPDSVAAPSAATSRAPAAAQTPPPATPGPPARAPKPPRVQRLADAGADVLVGAVADPDLGPVVGVGMGGRQAGLAGDVAFALVPLTDVDVDGLLRTPPGVRAWLEGRRGAAPLDAGALREVVLRFALLLDDVPEVAEVDLNPVRVMARGATVLDARIRLAPRPEPRRAKTW
ncbi:MAG TPA: acetate--CoA ligase family protein [Beijerinckiaceae bacterium]|nr:acetate--CoA ligase family protein [Beijerinckiaceae bacterium]